MIIAGIDYSISCPAITVWDSDTDLVPSNCLFFFNKNGGNKKEQKHFKNLNSNLVFPSIQYKMNTEFSRFFALSDWAFSILDTLHVDCVVLEAYSFGSRGLVFNIAEATSLLKFFINISGKTLFTVPPKQNKKLFSGLGNANKTVMINHFKTKYGTILEDELQTDSESPLADIIDSFALLYSYTKLEELNVLH